jgi:alkylation response protein AidB-like acyl-CoA dehydrogenase
MLERLQEVLPRIAENADKAEELRQMPQENVDLLKGIRMHHAFLPKAYGGLEISLPEFADCVVALSGACCSTAWAFSLLCTHNHQLAMFSKECQDDIWGDTPTGNPDAIALGTYAAAAEAMPVEGGFRISGKWPFASGCDHGDWALLGARFPANADGRKPVPGLVLVPRGDYEIIDDWHAVGLAASGSKTIACDDLFAPGHRHVLFPDLAGGRGPGRAVNTGAIFGVPLLAVLPVTIAAPALGILAAAIDDFTERTRVRETRGAVAGGGHSMAEFANVQSKLAEAAVALDAATLLLQRDISETLAIAKSCGIFSVDHRIRNRLSHGYAVKLAVDAINGLYGVGGGAELYRTGRLQRAWRDINAIAHHIGLNWDAISTMAGQHRLGLEPQGQY